MVLLLAMADLQILQAAGPLTIDGRPDEAVWRDARVLTLGRDGGETRVVLRGGYVCVSARLPEPDRVVAYSSRPGVEPGREDIITSRKGATAATLFAIFDGFRISDVRIERICLDGNRAHNESLNGNYVGCIFLRESNRVRMRQVVARNFNGPAKRTGVRISREVEDITLNGNKIDGFAVPVLDLRNT